MTFLSNLTIWLVLALLGKSVPDVPYEHYFHAPIPLNDELSHISQNFLPVYIKKNDLGIKILLLGTGEGLYQFNSIQNPNWENVSRGHIDDGYIFDMDMDKEGKVYIGAWNGLYIREDNEIKKVESLGNIPIAVVKVTDKKVIIGSPEGIWIREGNGDWERIDRHIPRSVRDIAIDGQGNIWIATEVGLIHLHEEQRVTHYKHNEDLFSEGYPEKELISNNLSSVCIKGDEVWAGGLGGITVFKNGKVIKKYLHKDFPGVMITKIVYDEVSGKVWIGTNNGLVCLPEGDIRNKMVFRSARWLLADEVKDIFITDDEIFISTPRGVSRLIISNITLAEKADYFEKVAQERHTREPGIVEYCNLRVPGDLSTWQAYPFNMQLRKVSKYGKEQNRFLKLSYF